jgi:hypothetical protein
MEREKFKFEDKSIHPMALQPISGLDLLNEVP